MGEKLQQNHEIHKTHKRKIKQKIAKDAKRKEKELLLGELSELLFEI
jgi:hypothetical protein